MELPAKVEDYFLRINKSNINQISPLWWLSCNELFSLKLEPDGIGCTITGCTANNLLQISKNHK